MELFNIEVEMASSLHDLSDEDLRSFAELQEDPANDEQIELYIYTCFLIFTRTRSTEYLEQAIQRMEGWIAVIAMDHPDRTRRFQILDMMSARMIQLRHVLEGVELSQTVATVLGEPQVINQRHDKGKGREVDGFSITQAHALRPGALAVDDHVYNEALLQAAMEESSSMQGQTHLNMARHGASLEADDIGDLDADIDSSELVTILYPSNSCLITSLRSTNGP